MRRRWPLLVLILAPLVALWPGLTGLAVGPFDQIRQMAPWNGPKPPGPWDVLMADSVLQSHVWRTLVFDAWGMGQLPLWNPYEFAGTPLLANSQSGGFYPPHIVLGLLHVPAGLGGFLLAWFHLALSGLGTYALVRRLGGSRPGALTGGLLFLLSPFLLGWAPLSAVLATVAWIPLALACATDAGNRRSWAALAASVGMMLLAGHLQFAAYGVMAVLFFTLVRALANDSPRPSGGEGPGVRGESLPPSTDVEIEGARPSPLPLSPGGARGSRAILAVGLALVLGAALSAGQLLPVLSYAKESHRRNVPSEEGYRAYVASALQPYELASLGHPMALGSPREAVEVGGTTVAAYWPTLLRRNFAESAVSLGAVGFALLFAVPWRRRETWPLAALGGIALLLALGTPLNRLLYFLVPGWSSTGSPGRIEVLFVLAACALAGLAVDGIAERRPQILAAGGAVLGMVLALVLPNLVTAEGPVAALRGAATAGAIVPILVATVATALFAFLAKRSLWAVPAGVALVAALTHATGLVPFGAPLEAPKGDPNVRIAVVNDPWDIVTAQPAVLPPNLAALGGLHELSGYDSLTSRDAVEMLRAVDGGTDPAPPANGNMMFVKPSLDPKALAECGVTEVWSRKPIPQLGEFEQRGGYVVHKIDGPGRVTNGRVVDGYDRQEIVGSAPGDVIVRDPFRIEWLPSSPAYDLFPYRATGLWRALTYRKADPKTPIHDTLRYEPAGLSFGLPIGIVAWLALLGLTVYAWRPSKRTRSV